MFPDVVPDPDWIRISPVSPPCGVDKKASPLLRDTPPEIIDPPWPISDDPDLIATDPAFMNLLSPDFSIIDPPVFEDEEMPADSLTLLPMKPSAEFPVLMNTSLLGRKSRFPDTPEDAVPDLTRTLPVFTTEESVCTFTFPEPPFGPRPCPERRITRPPDEDLLAPETI
jgi:hypothetical protein